MFLIKANGKIGTDNNMLKNNPNKKKRIDNIPQIIHKASFTVISQSIPSRLNSKMKPNGHLKERQKNKKKSDKKPSQFQNSWLDRVNAPTVKTIAPVRASGEGNAKYEPKKISATARVITPPQIKPLKKLRLLSAASCSSLANCAFLSSVFCSEVICL